MKKEISPEQAAELLQTLKARFENNKNRHPGLRWEDVQTKLLAAPAKLWTLQQMEITGGEPDVVLDEKTTVDGLNTIIFYDCAAESPKGRRSICYDQQALDSRKENKPANSALGMAAAMGVQILTEMQYRTLQSFGIFDAKTSSWIKTPEAIRNLGGAVFADYRYGQVFVYHNGAESYYAARGFRACLSL